MCVPKLMLTLFHTFTHFAPSFLLLRLVFASLDKWCIRSVAVKTNFSCLFTISHARWSFDSDAKHGVEFCNQPHTLILWKRSSLCMIYVLLCDCSILRVSYGIAGPGRMAFARLALQSSAIPSSATHCVSQMKTLDGNILTKWNVHMNFFHLNMNYVLLEND